MFYICFFFFSSRRRHTRFKCDWSSDVCSSDLLPMARIPEEQRTVALDLVWDKRREGYDPLQRVLEMFEGATTAAGRATRAAELAALPLDERLQRRIVDGERN